MALRLAAACCVVALLASPFAWSAKSFLPKAASFPPLATVGKPYSFQFTFVDANNPGSTCPAPMSVTPLSAPPPGLQLTAQGVLQGTPTAAGTFSFQLTAKGPDPNGPCGTPTTVDATLTVAAPTALSPASLPTGVVGTPYSQQLTASGGSGSFIFTLAGASPRSRHRRRRNRTPASAIALAPRHAAGECSGIAAQAHRRTSDAPGAERSNALESVQPGDVLVAATGDYAGCAITGDLVLGMARNCGAVGFITDGCVRDLPGLRRVGLPCYCIGVTPNSPARSGPGTVGFPVTIAGHPVASGDVIVADQDGVVVVPLARLDEVIARLPAIRKAEAEMDRAVRDGLRVPAFPAKE